MLGVIFAITLYFSIFAKKSKSLEMIGIEPYEQNILSEYGIDHDALYGNAHGREKSIVTNVRYVYWHILHNEQKISAGVISREFHKCRRLVYRGTSMVRYCIQYDKYFIDIYKKIKGTTD